MKVVIVTGLSGAGKTKVADWFEDQGYYVIDNMPPQLIRNFLELSVSNASSIERMALVADVRGGEFFGDLESCINDLRQSDDVDSTVIYLEASVSTIVKRYSETRRNHPLTSGKVTDSVIEDERALLAGMREKADYIIDTTGLKSAELDHELARIFLGNESESSFNINITSFGYKYGMPQESDIVVDMRFIPNPFYVDSLKKLTGNNKKVAAYVLRQDVTKKFIEDFHSMVTAMIPGYVNEGKYHINIAFGCTGGHHRSVAIANEMARIFQEEGRRVNVTHRDLDFISKGR